MSDRLADIKAREQAAFGGPWEAPEPVDPDAELVERMAEAMWRIEENPPTDYAGAIDDPEGWQELARAALLALRETHVVTPRAEQ